jgi:hypothetical protein
MNTRKKRQQNEGVSGTQVMIKSNVALTYVMRALQREAYAAPLAVCPPPNKQKRQTFCKIVKKEVDRMPRNSQ